VAEPSADFTLDTASLLAAEESEVSIVGRSPWYLAWRRLRRNKIAFVSLAIFIVIVLACAFAPLYAHHVAHTGPNQNHVTEKVVVDGTPIDIVSPGGTKLVNGELRVVSSIPIGPTWFSAGGKFVLGADQNGRDEFVRLLYGGRNSLLIGVISSLICTFLAVVLALLSGYYRGWVDWLITRFFDLSYAFPVILLAIALGSALSINGFHHFGLNVESGSIWIPTGVISYVLVPYIGRPLRGQILALREKEFIEAATSQGAGPLRIMFAEILPNIASSVLVFFTLIIAGNILTEAGLSFLGAGVQPPSPSWGTLISQGATLLVTRPWLTLAPGFAIVLTVLSLNIFGDGLRDALDPRAKVRAER
jgi:peptide/nickel transport system permease protein